MRKVKPLNDFIFKKLFGEKGNEDILLSFLNAVLKRTCAEPIEEVSIIENKELTKELIEDKTGIIDVRARTSKGEEIVALAKKYIGGKYVYGGTSLETGVDCSGFTQQIMKKNGISIERTSRGQYATNGIKVSVSDVKPGDLVFYGKNGVTVDHVAIYAGDNKIIHASDSKSGIKMSNLYYGKPIIGVKRVTN